MSTVLVVAAAGCCNNLGERARVLLEDVVRVRWVGEGDVVLPRSQPIQCVAIGGGVNLEVLATDQYEVGISLWQDDGCIFAPQFAASGRLAGDSKLASTIFTLSGRRGSTFIGCPAP